MQIEWLILFDYFFQTFFSQIKIDKIVFFSFNKSFLSVFAFRVSQCIKNILCKFFFRICGSFLKLCLGPHFYWKYVKIYKLHSDKIKRFDIYTMNFFNCSLFNRKIFWIFSRWIKYFEHFREFVLYWIIIKYNKR